MKYQCSICGYIYDEEKENKKFIDLENYSCPLCFVDKVMFKEYLESDNKIKDESKRVFHNAVKFDKDNLGVFKDDSKCIDCGLCKSTCLERCGLNFGEDTEKCLTCGQCIMTCPTGALRPKNEIEFVKDAMKSGKTMICYTSPSIRVSIGEIIGKNAGDLMTEELIGILRKLGFQYVLDTTFGADLTIMEEALELKSRILNKGVLPMFTSCCPAWVKYAETFYPEILEHVSTCKSPIGMQGEMVKNYFAKQMNLEKENIFTVAITPCTAKKFEIRREEIPGTDAVITVAELQDWIKQENIVFDEIEKSTYDSLLGEGSGAGVIFGNTGGVTEAALRTLYYFLTDRDLDTIEFQSVRGYDNVKEAEIAFNDQTYKIAVVHKLSAAKKIIEDVKNGVSPYHFIEIMNCQGGCIGGGGQPKYPEGMEAITKEKRIAGLYKRDKETIVRLSHHNSDIKKIYEDFLEKPNSEIAHQYLHTIYHNRKI